MSHSEHHGHHHHHHHHHDLHGKKLIWAVIINVTLTIVQIIGGVISGSLSLIADAIHNLSDAGSLIIAAIASKISKVPANNKMTFGYRRAEIIGALINSTTLVVIAFYLVFESIHRYLNPKPIDGWTVVWVASFALLIDVVTALLTYEGSKDSINIKAAFIHNVSDALASVVVIISGIIIINVQIYAVDLVATILISAYILYHGFYMLKKCISILMQSVPEHIPVEEVKETIQNVYMVENAHHIHLWQLDDKKIFLEAHIKISQRNLEHIETVKSQIKQTLKSKHNIDHTTLEMEIGNNCK